MLSHRLMLRSWTSHWTSLWFRKSPCAKYFQRFHKDISHCNFETIQIYCCLLLILFAYITGSRLNWALVHNALRNAQSYIATKSLQSNQTGKKQEKEEDIFLLDWEMLCKCHDITSEMCERSVDWALSSKVPVQCFSLYFITTQLATTWAFTPHTYADNA